MSSTALTKAREAVARARKNHEAKFERIEGGGITWLAGFALAEVEKRKIVPSVVFGNVPTRALIGVGLLFAASKARGSTRRVLDAAGNASLAVHGYATSKSGSFVAGEDDVLG